MLGAGWRECWEDGQAYDELNHRLAAILAQKEAITAAQKVDCLHCISNVTHHTTCILHYFR